MSNNNIGNCLLFHGGGLCPLSNLYLSTLAEALRKEEIFEQIYMGFFSFECLLNSVEFIKPWSDSLKEKATKAPGGFYGTGRDVDLTDPELRKVAIATCKSLGITWIGVAGGDGSCRQVSEISEAFELEGIHLFIPMPLTIDGIEGGMSLGLEPAVRKAYEVLADLAATNLQTRDNREFSVLFLETQGRNRDDILANLLDRILSPSYLGHYLGGISLIDIDLFVVTANYSWNPERLVEAINSSTRRTAVIYSEGAANDICKLQKDIKRKVRESKVGYLSQMNQLILPSDEANIQLAVKNSLPFIKSAVNTNKSFSLVFKDFILDPSVKDINYWAKLNPRKGQKPTLRKELEKLLKQFSPR